MAKKMTLEQRARKEALKYGTKLTPSSMDVVQRGVKIGYIAGWRARGRADAVTKAERAVIEAAIAYATTHENLDVIEGMNALRKIIAAVETLKARSAK